MIGGARHWQLYSNTNCKSQEIDGIAFHFCSKNQQIHGFDELFHVCIIRSSKCLKVTLEIWQFYDRNYVARITVRKCSTLGKGALTQEQFGKLTKVNQSGNIPNSTIFSYSVFQRSAIRQYIDFARGGIYQFHVALPKEPLHILEIPEYNGI